MIRRSAAVVLAALIASMASVHAEVLVRWDRDDVPSPESLGLGVVVIPASNRAAVGHAVARGYRVYLEVDADALPALVLPPSGLAGVVVKGAATGARLTELERRLAGRGARLLVVDDRGKWPHIRSNWVTRNNEVLQVARRSAQPWIDNNVALARLLRATASRWPAVLSYRWTPPTIATVLQAPGVENYLVAIAESGSFGRSLVLGLDAELQANLLLGTPSARLDWARIRQHLEFYGWDLPERYQAITNIGIVTVDPMASFEVMNLLARHNLPFDIIEPSRLSDMDTSSLDLLVVLDRPSGVVPDHLMAFARRGGTVVVAGAAGAERGAESPAPWQSSPASATAADRATYDVGTGRVIEMLQPIVDPDRFALEIRQILGPTRRVLDIWNGITVLATTFAAPDGDTVLVTAVNYAQQPLPVQLRVRGLFSIVHHESPEEPLSLLRHTHREGYTEIVVPSLRTGARVFLSDRQRSQE